MDWKGLMAPQSREQESVRLVSDLPGSQAGV
jgi:hypothetical protein